MSTKCWGCFSGKRLLLRPAPLQDGEDVLKSITKATLAGSQTCPECGGTGVLYTAAELRHERAVAQALARRAELMLCDGCEHERTANDDMGQMCAAPGRDCGEALIARAEIDARDSAVPPLPPRIDQAWLDARFGWSLATFGTGQRTAGIVEHIRHELEEILAAGGADVMEWVDVLLLAFDGAARAGFSSVTVLAALQEKHRINVARRWPAPGPEDQPTFHVRDGVSHDAE